MLSLSLVLIAAALGIGAASFWRRKLETEAEAKARKDIAESPTAEPERPKKQFREVSCGLVDVVNLNSRYLNS